MARAKEVETEDIVIEFEGNFDLDTVLDKRLQFLGMDSREPVLKIDSKFYKVDIQDSVGTRLLFRKGDPAEGTNKLEFASKSDKQITAHRVMVRPK